MRQTYFVDAAHAGSRLDAFLVLHLPGLSRSRIKSLITAGRVTVDGAPGKPAEKVRRGQRVEVDLPPPPPAPALVPEPLPLQVVYEDRALLVIAKPPGLAVHPGAGRSGGTLANAILARFPELAGVGPHGRPGIVHRLDKDTSGLLVVARTAEAYAALVAQVAARQVARHYLALVWGALAQREGTIDAPIARHPLQRTRMAVVPSGRPAVTRYRVLERFARFTLVEAQLVTGRTHQIRVHFAHIGHPVAGDRVYGRRPDVLGIGRQALHAWRLQLRHPETGQAMAFEAPVPPDLAGAIARAREDQGTSAGPRRNRKA